jgi:hypothetical protein
MADLHRFRTRADISRSDRRARRPPHRRPLRLRRRARRIRHPAGSRRRRPCGVAEGQTRPGAGARADASGAAGGVIGVEFFPKRRRRQAAVSGCAKNSQLSRCRRTAQIDPKWKFALPPLRAKTGSEEP